MAKRPLCSIPNCGKPHYGYGWCKAHCRRWQRNGDPLGGRTPTGEPLRYFKEVVLPYEGDECLPWPYGRDKYGYGRVWDGKKKELVHRLSCEEAHGPPPTPDHEAAHECGKGHLACCAKRHLSWKTHAENMADTIIHGTSTRNRPRLPCGRS